ncbi:MAG: aldehyde dehydrogenase family protein [Nitrososphaerota archaeon]
MMSLKCLSENYGKLLNYIDGEYVEADYVGLLKSYDPGIGRVIAEVPVSSSRDVEVAVSSALEAFKKWAQIPIIERMRYLIRLRSLIEEKSEELALMIAQNVGKTIREGRGEVQRTIEAVDSALGLPHLFMSVRKLMNVAGGDPEIDMEMVREPLGVFAIISPFNFPVMIPMWFIPMAITLGNTVIVKPSELDPVPITYFMKLFKDAGYPNGVVNLVNGDASTSQHLIEHKDIVGVAFVGSSSVAEKIYSAASSRGKRVLCQAGAKNPVVLMPDATPDQSVENIVTGFFDMAGQRCLAPGLLITVGEAYDKFVEMIVNRVRRIKVGYQLLKDTDVGPLASQKGRHRVVGMIEKALEEGAETLIDGREYKIDEKYQSGFYLGPTILDNVSPDMEIAREEVFGPVMPIVRASSFEEALEIANSRMYGNTGTIYTSSGKYAREFARRMNAGNIAVNMAVAQPNQFFPFPGRKKSFYGVLHGQTDALDFFTDRKVIMQRWW